MATRQKKFARRRRRRVPGRRTKSSFNPTRNLSCIPDKFFTKMVYSGSHVLAPATAPASHLYRAGSIFDPDQTGTGHQPLGHDEFAALYKQYRVRGVAYKITFINTSPSDPVDCFVVHKPTSSVTSSLNLLWEKPAQRHVTCGQAGSGQAVRSIKGYANPAKILGLTKIQYNTEKATSSQMGSNPASDTFIHFVTSPSDGATSVSILVRVQLVYYVELFERVPLNGS